MTALSECYNTKFNVPKPDFPYTIGKRLHVRSHIPPSPPPADSKCGLKFDGFKERETTDIVQRCLQHPPLPGKFPPGGITELEIVKLARAGDGHSAQLLAIQVLKSSLNLPFGVDLVAKFYDPLYFDHEQDDADPFICVDTAYARETAVYRKLVDFQGCIIPKYYGSFSLSLPVDPGSSREVRLVIIEYVAASSMRDLSPASFTTSERQIIMRALIDAETTMYNREVRHNDIHPRNVLVSPQLSDHRKVVLIDFGNAWTTRSPFPEWEWKYLPGIPISPLLRWIKPLGDFDEWVDWDWKAWVEQQYGHERGSITEYMQKKWGSKM